MNDPRCLIADDHPALTSAVSSYLSENGFDVVGPASDGRRAVALMTDEKPDLALVDYRMPRLSGADLVRALCEASPETRIVVYTADGDERLAREVLDAGAVALVLKEAPLADLVRALEAALNGSSYLDPALAKNPAPGGKLTQRELDVLGLLARGQSNGEIADELVVAETTVKTHVARILAKLGVRDRVQAVVVAYESGFVDQGR